MSIYAISDLHLGEKPMDIFGPQWTGHFEKIKASWEKLVKTGDIVLIAGDISWAMNLEKGIADIVSHIGDLKGEKVIIRGNHDYWWGSAKRMRESLPKSVHIIQNDAVKIGDYIFAGSRGWQESEPKELTAPDDVLLQKRELIRLEMSLTAAKKLQKNSETLVVLRHYPPFNSRIEPSATTALLGKFGVKYCVYGHLHGSAVRSVAKAKINDVTYLLSSCDLIGFELIKIEE
ncbi:MAG: metallophosphoesterase [Christensenellaceae bacterium]|jgi:predicted phosphohydrolase|nr:metallophosphoesterase [Christensenellaceae bacterium]